MALQKTLNLPASLTAKGEFGEIVQEKEPVAFDAYIKVETVTGNKFQVASTISLTDNKKVFYRTYEFSPDLAGPNFIAQAYLHLKTLPEFSDATDC